MNKDSKIYVAGHNGMVGSAILRKLKNEGYTNLIYKDLSELDLRVQRDVESFFMNERPEYVFLAAAVVGGIQANINNPSKFLLDNLRIQNNVIEYSYKYGVKKLLFLGSSCIYPRNSPQPMKEEYLLNGKLEPTNEGYALAKIAGLKLVEYYNRQYGVDFISAMPCNVYGYNDNFSPQESHVLAATIIRVQQAIENKSDIITIWGDGSSKREFIFVDDLAEALLFLMNNYSGAEHINVGSGTDVTILQLNYLVAKILGYKGKIEFDLSKPNGMPRKLLDITKLKKLGWHHKINLESGIRLTIEWYNKKSKNEFRSDKE